MIQLSVPHDDVPSTGMFWYFRLQLILFQTAVCSVDAVYTVYAADKVTTSSTVVIFHIVVHYDVKNNHTVQ